jgi:putative heme-binding domain-containing protein
MAVHGKNPLARLHALGTLASMGKDAYVPQALRDPHPAVRRQAIRMADRLFLDTMFERGQGLMEKLLDDPDAQVRLQLAYSLGECRHEQAAWALGRLAATAAGDKHFLAAVFSSVNAKNFDSFLEGTCNAGKGVVAPIVLENLLRMAGKLGPRHTAKILGAMAFADAKQDAAERFTAVAGFLDTLDGQGTPLAFLWSKADADLKRLLQQLDRVFETARTITNDRKASIADRVLAVRLLGRGIDNQASDVNTLVRLLGPDSAADLQSAAIAALGKIPYPKVPAILLERWRSLSPAQRAQAFDVLLSRGDGPSTLMAALERKEIGPFDVDAARRQRLLDHKDASLKSRAAKIFATSVSADRQKVIESYRAVLTIKGDAQHGAKVFAKSCAGCHQLGGVGQQVGPDLGSVADKSSDGLLLAILDPNRAVEARYINYTAVTKAGRTYSGLIASETGTSLTLVGVDGKSETVLRTDLDELFSSGKSAMPEGLEKDVPLKDMADLIAFVQGQVPAPKRKVFTGNQPEKVRPENDGSLRLKASSSEIFGRTLVFEKPYDNLGYWSSPDDRAVWTVEVPREGHYVVWLDWACADQAAGNTLELASGAERMTAKVPSTGSWDTYRFARHGEIRLAAGTQQIVMRAAGPIRGALIDLKEIKLIHSSLKNQFP